MKTPSFFLALTTLCLLSSPAFAFLRQGEIASSSLVQRGDGICAIPNHLPGAKYGKKDVEHEAELCSLERGVNVAACPKRRSTNPAIELFSPPAGMSVQDLERRECVVKEAKKQAKYKLSFSCSYSPGMLAYYHVSRALGNVANVPPAVLRTYDFRDHKDMAERALRLLQNRSTFPIYKWWSALNDAFNQGSRSEVATRIFTEDMNYTWGAVVRNVRGESEYPEFNGVFGRPDRLDDFRRGPIYGALVNPSLRVGRELNAQNALALRQLKDAADFILLDTLLSQQDRFGNFHFKPKAYYLASKDGRASLEKADSIAEVPAEFRAKAVLVKEMVLRDNDCGVGMMFTGRAKKARLLEGVAHMDPDTYSYFMGFASRIDDASTRDFFIRGLQLRESDFNRMRQNVKEAAATLKDGCLSGRLSLDLSLSGWFTGQPVARNCEP